jgi:hypothetical protein
MGWIILGIVFLVVTIWSLRGTTFAEYHYQNRVDEHHVAVWMLIIAFIIYCIPIIGIMAFIAYHIWFSILASRKPHHSYEYLIIELSKENVLHRILGTIACYLTKEV